MYFLDDNKKIGIGFLMVSISCFLLGIILFFDRAMLVFANLTFLVGLGMLVGVKAAMGFFLKKGKLKGSLIFFLGFLIIVFKFTLIGFGIQLWGIFILFKSFFPFVYDSLTKLPVVGRYLRNPQIKQAVDNLSQSLKKYNNIQIYILDSQRIRAYGIQTIQMSNPDINFNEYSKMFSPLLPIITNQGELEDLQIQSLEAELQMFQETDIAQLMKRKGCLKTELKYVSSPPSSPRGRTKLQVTEKVAERSRIHPTDHNKHKKQLFIEHLKHSEFSDQ